MGLNISPVIWQSYINAILNCLQNRKYCEAIIDNLLLFTPMKSAHFDKLEDLLKALHKNGLKISPKKCQLFKTDLQYMGNTIFIRDKRCMCKTVNKSKRGNSEIRASYNNCRSFVGIVNFVSIFCPELQKLLKPIYDLTRKGRQFMWGEEQQKAFDEIKHRLQKPPVLHLPDRHGQFQLYSDTSKFATGSALYQIQNGEPGLIAYASKRMPEAAKNNLITELEMWRLAMNIATFLHLLKKVDFDAVVNHLAITHVMRSKAEPATTRIKRLIELLSPYSFNLYYIKGKDMVLSDFLSRQKMDNSNPHEIIPISFTLKGLLGNHFYRIDNMNAISQPETNKYLIKTRSQTKSGGIKVPEIHGANKGLDPHVKLGRQRSLPTLPMHRIPPISLTQPIDKGLPPYPTPKPRIGQGRAGLKRKIRTNQTVPLPRWTIAQPIQTPDPKKMWSLPEPIVQSQEKVQLQYHIPIPLPQHQPVDPTHIIQPIGPKIQHRPSPPYHDLYARPPPRPPDITNSIDSWKDLLDTDLDRNVDIEENSPFLEGIISETYERPDNSYI